MVSTQGACIHSPTGPANRAAIHGLGMHTAKVKAPGSESRLRGPTPMVSSQEPFNMDYTWTIHRVALSSQRKIKRARCLPHP